MAAKNNVFRKIKPNRYLLFQFIPLSFMIFFFAFMLLRFPESAGKGVKNGIMLCFSTLLPSIFPFMLLSSFFAYSGICDKWGSFFNKITYLLFRQPGISSSVVLLSMVGGLPIGARLTKQLFEEKKITADEGKRLLLFCMNPGPAFVVSGVGYYMLSSKKAGVILYAAVVISSLFLGYLTRFLTQKSQTNEIMVSNNFAGERNVYDALILSVSKSTVGMAGICAWVVIFSCMIELLNVFPMSENFKLFFTSVLEMTCGCKSACAALPISVVAGIIGFGGLCAHCQIMPSIIALKLNVKHFLISRIINAAFSVVICEILLKIFPVAKEVSYGGENFSGYSVGISAPIAVGLLTMCVMLLLGNNFIFIKKRKKPLKYTD